MAQAVSSEIKSTFFSISSADLLSSWFGESEKLIKQLFEYARSCDRSIIFIDEIDSLCRKRTTQEAETTRRVKTELLKQMEGALGKSVFLLCATNCPWELDTAFLRRFSKRIYVPLPNAEVRKQIFTIHLKGIEINISEEDFEQLAEKTNGYSGSDIANCVSEAVLEPIRELKKCVYWVWSDDKSFLRPSRSGEENAVCIRIQNIPKEKVQPREVTVEDLLNSINLNKRTICNDELVRFEKFTEEFGQNA